MAITKPSSARYRWAVTSRVVAAVIPGFVLTNSAGVLISFIIPGEKFTGIAWATLLSFVIYAAIIMWIFHTDRLKTVWLGLLGCIAFTSLASWGLYVLNPDL